MKIEGEKVLALIGNSGGGKTTLIKLLAGYIKADSGEILVDGQKLSETSLKSYYQNIGYLTQEPSVFDGTILENLLYGVEQPHPTLSLKERDNTNPHAFGIPLDKGDKNRGRDVWQKHLENIISLAKCEFIYDLPKGIETEIGERGVRLSGGQRQRLAIAKIMLKNPKIIFLDEPTSALDSFSEEQVSESLHNLFVGRTVIIIAHRLQTVKKADKILVLESGKIVEEGNHNSLIEQNGIYKKMLDLQSGF